jgi:hypothetical protein
MDSPDAELAAEPDSNQPSAHTPLHQVPDEASTVASAAAQHLTRHLDRLPQLQAGRPHRRCFSNMFHLTVIDSIQLELQFSEIELESTL